MSHWKGVFLAILALVVVSFFWLGNLLVTRLYRVCSSRKQHSK
jgi:hypothetical protein